MERIYCGATGSFLCASEQVISSLSTPILLIYWVDIRSAFHTQNDVISRILYVKVLWEA